MASRSIKNRANIKKKNPFVGVLIAFAVIAVLIGAGAISAYAVAASWLEDLPEYKDASLYNTARKTEVYANDGTTVLANFYIENRDPVNLDQVSPYVTQGTVATEDERFYEHDGVDIVGTIRAVVVTLTGGGREGGSSITQQFVRATVLSAEANDISVKRKLREMYISLELEKMFSKDEILQMYLNTINYGSGAYGIEAAAQRYFSKPASELTLIESAALIGIPNSPTYFNPIDYPQNCLDRRNLVLDRMRSNEYITQEEYDAAVAEPLMLNVKEINEADNGVYRYHYFSEYIRETLLDQFTEAEVFKGGMKVYTTLDPAIQDAAEEAVRKKEASIDSDIIVAMTAVDPETGFIKAMVGGKDYHEKKYNFATHAKRSCGSTFKPIVLVAALEAGIAPSEMVNCASPIYITPAGEISGSGNENAGDWRVENYGGANYSARPVSGALAISSNTAFARLGTILGPQTLIETAHRLGIESELPDVRSISLGAVEVSTDEMASVYGTIANGGTHHESAGIEKILDVNGDVIFEADTTGDRALTPEVAYAAADTMKGVVSGGTGTDAALPNGQPVAGKTGTSSDWNDRYFCGATPYVSVALWMGAEEPRKMPASYTPNSVFRDFVSTAYGDYPVSDFPVAPAPPYTKIDDKRMMGGAQVQEPKEEEPKEEEPDDPNPTPTPTPTPDPDPDPDPDPEPPGPEPEPEPGSDSLVSPAAFAGLNAGSSPTILTATNTAMEAVQPQEVDYYFRTGLRQISTLFETLTKSLGIP